MKSEAAIIYAVRLQTGGSNVCDLITSHENEAAIR
jgi:hypothetical protein